MAEGIWLRSWVGESLVDRTPTLNRTASPHSVRWKFIHLSPPPSRAETHWMVLVWSMEQQKEAKILNFPVN